jgi:heptosyltransferase I
MRILIIKTSSLGDIVNALPVLNYLRLAALPNCQADWVVEEQFRDVLEGNPLISMIHTVRTKIWRKHPLAAQTRREIRELKRAMHDRGYDLAFDIQGNLKSGLITSICGAPAITGFLRPDLQESINALFTTCRIPLMPEDRHVTEKYLRIVSAPFNRNFHEMKLSSDIFTSPENDALAEALLAPLRNGPLLLFHYGTTWQTKFWSREGWIALSRLVIECYPTATVLFSWGNRGELQVASELAAQIGPKARVLERYDLKGFAAILKKVDVVVGGDTGPVHLAAAVGTPTVSFYRSSDSDGSGPRGPRHVVIQSPLACTRCFRTNCTKNDECQASITAKALFDGVHRLLESQTTRT